MKEQSRVVATAGGRAQQATGSGFCIFLIGLKEIILILRYIIVWSNSVGWARKKPRLREQETILF
jgi:hypothetical protein